MRVHLLHGFNVRDAGKASTDRLKPYFYAAGYQVLDHDYGWLGLVGVRLLDARIAARVAASVVPGDIGCGHSNGCTILSMAAEMGAPFAGLVYINPALDRDTPLAPHIPFAQVYNNDGDDAVEAARFLVAHPWGDMGRVGYIGPDWRYQNINCSRSLQGHSALFADIKKWGPIVIDNLEQRRASS